MPELTNRYRIEYQVGENSPWYRHASRIADHLEAERKYETFRNQNPTLTVRLIHEVERIERTGKGRVYL